MTKDIILITTEAYKISKDSRQFQGHSEIPYNIMASDWNKGTMSYGQKKDFEK